MNIAKRFIAWLLTLVLVIVGTVINLTSLFVYLVGSLLVIGTGCVNYLIRKAKVGRNEEDSRNL